MKNEIVESSIRNIINDDSFKTAMNDIIQLHTEMILNSDIEDKEVREIAYIKIKVVNEVLSHLQSIADGDKINKANDPNNLAIVAERDCMQNMPIFVFENYYQVQMINNLYLNFDSDFEYKKLNADKDNTDCQLQAPDYPD